MNKEDFFEALKDIDENEVHKAGKYKKIRNKGPVKWLASAACVMIAVGLALGVPMITRNSINETAMDISSTESGTTDIGSSESASTGITSALISFLAVYPEAVAADMSSSEYLESDEYWDYRMTHLDTVNESKTLQEEIDGYYSTIMSKLLVSDDKNTVCSPLNTYIAFSVLAEVTDGNTRQQLLDMLNVSDIETLRSNITTIWNSNYQDTPILKSLLANSLWLNEKYDFNDETLNLLTEYYYASSFIGNPASDEMNDALRTWTDENTGNLLSEYTQEMSMDSDTVLNIVSTIYYKAMWNTPFTADATTTETFHGTKGDTDVDMMHMSETQSIYTGDHFTSIGLPLYDSGSMYFYLPNEGVDVNELASDPEVLTATTYDNEEAMTTAMVNMSIPKFNVTAKTDLIETMEALGITDVLDPALSDFTPLTTDHDELYLDKAVHAAMVEIDEEGVTGAAYTELGIAGDAIALEEIDFTLDRPFMFVITGNDGSILFSGIVRNID